MRTVQVLLATLIVLVLLSGTNVSTAAQPAGQSGPVAAMAISATKISWQPRTPNAGLYLRSPGQTAQSFGRHSIRALRRR